MSLSFYYFLDVGVLFVLQDDDVSCLSDLHVSIHSVEAEDVFLVIFFDDDA